MSVSLDQLCINTIRTLSMDAVQKANSGHPGTPMALAPVAYTLWQRHMRFDPNVPHWPNRDRFVLSCGHASMLLYSVLHLAGVKQLNADGTLSGELAVTLDQIKNFRQLNSRTPGHPESHITTGVETTTGPLGQGCGNSVGIAIAGRWLAATYNRPGHELFNFRTWVLAGDGDMMEGISGEAASLAGHQKLSNLCWIYDSNRITIEGKTDLAFSEDVATRFQGYGWHTIDVADVNDLDTLQKAFTEAENTKDRPTLIVVHSHIGFGAPKKQDTHAAHGEPLGDEEIKGAKHNYGWPEDAKFLVPDGVRENFAAQVGKRGEQTRAAWDAAFKKYQAEFPDLAKQLTTLQARKLPEGWDKDLPVFPTDAKGLATRESSGKVLNAAAKNIPWLLGGAADLAPSTKTLLTFEGATGMQAATPGGRNMHFGIREHAMGAILNGMAVTSLRPYGAGFLIFSDYGRPSIRLASLMELPVLYIFTHDSIGVGEDGPTHEPIEQLASLRAIPGVIVLRPGDANEVTEAYRVALNETHRPIILALTRQAIPTFDRTKFGAAAGVAKGGYILADAPGGKPDLLLIGTGSEVALCMSAYERLTKEGVKARVVSLPSWELFARQTPEYREQVIPSIVKARVCVEMGSTFGWERFAGPTGAIVGMHTFGASAPLKDLLVHFGFTVDAVVAAAHNQLSI